MVGFGPKSVVAKLFPSIVMVWQGFSVCCKCPGIQKLNASPFLLLSFLFGRFSWVWVRDWSFLSLEVFPLYHSVVMRSLAIVFLLSTVMSAVNYEVWLGGPFRSGESPYNLAQKILSPCFSLFRLTSGFKSLSRWVLVWPFLSCSSSAHAFFSSNVVLSRLFL